MSDQYSEFRACGTVVRKFISPKGNFASLTLTIEEIGRNGRRFDSKQDFIMFDNVNALSMLPQGALVSISGRVSFGALTDKKREQVKVDGFAKFVPQLIITEVKPAIPLARTIQPAPGAKGNGASAPATPDTWANTSNDDDIPF